MQDGRHFPLQALARRVRAAAQEMPFARPLGDIRAMPHGKPDFANAEFVLFVGTAPGQAGNPFKRQGTLVAKARTQGKLSYVVVDPVLTHADNRASGDRGRWLPLPDKL